MFRYERPQAGRLREFHQVEQVFGSSNPATDVENDCYGSSILQRSGIINVSLG